MKNEKNNKVHVKFKSKGKSKTNYKWCFTISFITFMISLFLNLASSILTSKLSLIGAIFILLSIVLIGIGFDILGTAVVSGDIIVYSSMAANKVRGAKEAIYIVKNANVFSNIFNDVIGDTCGIISGATVSAIFVKVAISGESIWFVIVSALIAALTVGGKALGKGFAIKHSLNLVYRIGYFISLFNIKSYFKK